MVLGYSPFSCPAPGLRNIDLVIHADLLKRIVLEKIPTVKEVSFIDENNLTDAVANPSSSGVHKLRVSVFSRKTPVCLDPDKIILPIDTVGEKTTALLLTGLDNLMIRSADEQWLRDTGAEIVKEFLDERNSLLDPVTGFCNGTGFNAYLASQPLQKNHHVILVESIPPAKSVKDALAHVSRTARLLEEFNKFSFPLFHLSNSIFCLIISDRDPEFVKWLCRSLTTLARNSGLRKIRAGFSSYRPERHGKFAADKVSPVVVEEAWQALQKAGRRGPYAFCDYELLVNPEGFPLSPPPSSCVAKISYRVKDSDKFSLIYFKPDFNNSESVDSVIESYIADESVIKCLDGYIVVRQGQDERETKKWAASLIERLLEDRGERYSMSAGISTFPFRDYKKSEIIKNCQKALLHGSFFGPASSVIFDALSLNVSGDAYFSESDLSGAVKEYRRGLDLSPDDVNLLNSLGVTYALMNKTTKAQEIFDQVIA
ncbi:MAG: tetratricopeptide repeat protein, partial [Desulfofustis sp.]